MNIDFHYGVMYLVGRVSGLDTLQAERVAHACQYVDDATSTGVLTFREGQSYERFASAHQMLDYKNELNAQDRLVWVPFHFLPAALGTTLEEMTVCRPDSAVAREMVRRAIEARGHANALHRLGVTLHTYVDTWAHQGFAGIRSRNNIVRNLQGDEHSETTWRQRLEDLLHTAESRAEADLMDRISLLGHGAALHFPDMPWATWEYVDGHGARISRENLPAFMAAAEMASRAIRGFLANNLNFEREDGLPADFRAELETFLKGNRSHDGDVRLATLDAAVRAGTFSGIPEPLPPYIAKGVGSWEWQALGIADADDGAPPEWTRTFEESDYRLFHDALKQHRFVVTQEILPAAGVRLA